MAQVIFISDLHLAENTEILNQDFRAFCEHLPATTSSVYILGDLVRWWLGDDDSSPFNNWLIETLKLLTSKTKVYLLPGNRDFLMGEKFTKSVGITLLNDPTIVTLNQQNYLLTHGDFLTNHTFLYRAFYRISHFGPLKKLFCLLPLKLRLFLVKKLYQFSQKRHPKNTTPVLVPNLVQLKKLAKTRDFDQIIYGHIHTETKGSFNYLGKTIFYRSLPMWKDDNCQNYDYPSYIIEII